MGQEATCEARFGGKVSTGKALLETDALIFPRHVPALDPAG